MKIPGIYIVMCVVVSAALLLVILYVPKNTRNTIAPTESETVLVVPRQEPNGKVFIASVNLSNSGFLAVRSITAGRIGQIIEISEYLTAGTHTNLTIDLGDFPTKDSELIVVAYTDAAADQTFNDLDQPLRGADANVVAKYVTTGESVPAELFVAAGESTPHVMGGIEMQTVRYTKDGYVPAHLEVSSGTMVQFINEIDDPMWVASDDHPGHGLLPTFDQFLSSGKDSVYTYTFDTAGVWTYHDHIQPAVVGEITVR